MNKIPISVLINTFNEEKNIKNCLECVKWADEIIIVDMYSDDRTVEIAKNYTEKIFFFQKMGYADPARQFALEKASNDWILVVDADELIPLNLKNKLVSILKNDNADVIFVPRKNYFFGHLMEGAKWGSLQDRIPRFFKKECVSFSDQIHDFFRIKDNSRIYYIDNPEEGVIHFNYVDMTNFIDKLNRYTTIEAKLMFQNKKELSLIRLISSALLEFSRRMITSKGYKDGYLGISLSLTMVFYRLITFTKFKLMKKYETIDVTQKVEENYQELAHDVIFEYNE